MTHASCDGPVLASDGHQVTEERLRAEKTEAHAGRLRPVLQRLGVGEVHRTRTVVDQGDDNLKGRQQTINTCQIIISRQLQQH